MIWANYIFYILWVGCYNYILWNTCFAWVFWVVCCGYNLEYLLRLHSFFFCVLNDSRKVSNPSSTQFWVIWVLCYDWALHHRLRPTFLYTTDQGVLYVSFFRPPAFMHWSDLGGLYFLYCLCNLHLYINAMLHVSLLWPQNYYNASCVLLSFFLFSGGLGDLYFLYFLGTRLLKIRHDYNFALHLLARSRWSGYSTYSSTSE